MATHVFVVDSSFKRTQIKVTPGKSLREVLEEACQSRRLNPEGYALKTQSNKTLDLSQPFRLSGLSPGAKLQLTQASKSPGVVSVALQLPESEGSSRLSDKFASTTSLWLILRKFEDAVAGAATKKLNLTQRGVPSGDSGAGRLMYEQPCLHAVGRNFDTFTDLQKTLGQLGLNGGSALLRLTFKPSAQPLEQAMAAISDFFSTSTDTTSAAPSAAATTKAESASAETDEALPGASQPQPELVSKDAAVSPAEPAPTTTPDIRMEPEANAQSLHTDEPTSVPTAESQAPTENTLSNDKLPGISVYHPPSSSTPAAALLPDDPSVFEPSIDHAKAHQAELNRAGRPQRLLSDKELAEQAAQRQQATATIRSVQVRVRYPDQSQIETSISASESAADMYARVAETVAASPDEPFELRYTATIGTKVHHHVLPQSAKSNLVRDCGFRGNMLLTFVWSPDASLQARQGPSLKAEYRQQAVDLKIDLANAQASQHSGAASRDSAGPAKEDKDSSGGASGKKMDVEAKMKRFLGFGKK